MLRRIILFLIGIFGFVCFGKEVAITIDDGPSIAFLEKVLPILERYGAKATFFVEGKYIQKDPSTIKLIVEKGHEVGNHTFSHRALNRLSDSQIREEIERTDRLIREGGGNPRYLRPPYGAVDARVYKIAKELGYTVVFWSVDPQDWRDPPPQFIVNYVLKHARDKSVILLHEKRNTWKALPGILEGLSKKGFRCVSLQELYAPASVNYAGQTQKEEKPPIGRDFLGRLVFYALNTLRETLRTCHPLGKW